MKCLNCKTETKNAKFCSRSCASSYNNKKFPKRKPTKGWNCKHCGVETPKRRTVCDNCGPGKDMTLKEAIYTQHHKSSAYSLVRTRARTIAKNEGMNSCQNCGYDKHVEIAHKKAISEFDENTMISEINDVSNLMALCPNCHWEYDHPE